MAALGSREEDCHGNVSLEHPIRMETSSNPQALPTEAGPRETTKGSPWRQRLALRGHHRLVTAVISKETEAGQQEEPPAPGGAGNGEGHHGVRTQRQQSSLLGVGEWGSS